MGPHVLIQVGGLRERLTTTLEFTLTWFFPCMCPHVRIQVGELREGQATTRMPALKGFLTRMGPHVRGQVGGLRERQATPLKGTFKGFLTRMGPHVSNQQTGTGAYHLTIRPGTLVFLSPRTLMLLNLRRTLHAVLSVLWYILCFHFRSCLLNSDVIRMTHEFNKKAIICETTKYTTGHTAQHAMFF